MKKPKDPEERLGPLNGIVVLDMTQFLAGPFSTQILADLGAQIIKLEAPTGDWSRTLPPHFVGSDSCYYLSINRNKQGIVIDNQLSLVQQFTSQHHEHQGYKHNGGEGDRGVD